MNKEKNLTRLVKKLSKEKPHQAGGEFPLSFALVPWRQRNSFTEL